MYLISGGGSQLGLNTARALVAEGQKVVLTTRRRNDPLTTRVVEESGGLASMEILDLTNMYEVVNLMSRYDIKRVVHTATAHMYAHSRAANFPSYQMLFNMLEAATSFGVERLVLCNSFVVYRGVEGPFREDQALPPDFLSQKTGVSLEFVPPFEVTLKRIMEAIALDYGAPMAMWDQAPKLGGEPRSRQMETVVLRFPAQAGPFYNSMYNPVACLVHAYVKQRPDLLADRPLRGFADISYARDNADATCRVAMADELPNRIYNVSSGVRVTGREVLEALYRVAPDAKALLKLEPADQAHTPNKQYLDINRIREDLGWSPQFNIDTLLADYIDWLRSNPY
ncbi:MAG TPA: NAD(P)-dependent oxidoreductase [Phenylobacterium sp.]|nr:NAD(P)-dependent oxidoreductase [Phenylobacterium sp.]